MNGDIKIIARVAVFAALVFIFSYFSMFISGFNLSFFIVFASAFVWGLYPGLAVGVVGFFLWSNFNPFGPAPLPLLISQLIGISMTAVIGKVCSKIITLNNYNPKVIVVLSLAGLFSGLTYHLIVDIVDAWLYQPFIPRLMAGLFFSLITIVSNAIIFPLLYPALRFLGRNETGRC
ncbi:MAG: hypothetical protein ABIJ45_06670 [Candidatus Zixiibacteriota bacterium]